MNKAQRVRYHADLWPAACKTQRWNPRDKDLRQSITYQVTGKLSSEDLDEDEITMLFDELRHLADPVDFDQAMLAANPELSRQANRRRQLVWTIEQLKLSEAYVDALAADYCRHHRVDHWDQLPLDVLAKFRMTCRARARSLRDDYRAPINKLGPNPHRTERLRKLSSN